MSPSIDSIFLLVYPDNPSGAVFIEAFFKKKVKLRGVIVEKKAVKSNNRRLRAKLKKDGPAATAHRICQIIVLKLKRMNVIEVAKKNHVPVYFVDDFNGQDCIELLEGLHIDLLVIASAPILKPDVFNKAKVGCLNAHPGWLPKYRGIGANAHALANGDSPGVSIHWVDAGIDTGRIIRRIRLPIEKKDTIAKINDRAVEFGARMMCDVIMDCQAGCLVPEEIQEEAGPVYKAMSYHESKKINRSLKKRNEKSNAI